MGQNYDPDGLFSYSDENMGRIEMMAVIIKAKTQNLLEGSENQPRNP